MKKRNLEPIPAIEIGKKELAELRKIGEGVIVPVLERSHYEVQQSIVIASLIEFLKLHGIISPFALKRD